jgi:hypothetical protein
MNQKPTPAIGKLTRGGRIVLMTLSGLVLITAFGLYGYMNDLLMKQFDPDQARSEGLLGPLTEITGYPGKMEGYIYINYHVFAYGDCAFYQHNRSFGTTAVGEAPPEVHEFIIESSKAEGKNAYDGYYIYIRFIGKQTWLHNAGFGEGYGHQGGLDSKVDILEVLEMQPLKDACPK